MFMFNETSEKVAASYIVTCNTEQSTRVTGRWQEEQAIPSQGEAHIHFKVRFGTF